MSHKTYRGKVIDMHAMASENKETIAQGNMGVNAQGDVVRNGKVVETSSSRARRQSSSTKTTVTTDSLKDTMQDDVLEQSLASTKKKPAKTKSKTEVELDNGDIIVEEE